jgi:hypothetical protein
MGVPTAPGAAPGIVGAPPPGGRNSEGFIKLDQDRIFLRWAFVTEQLFLVVAAGFDRAVVIGPGLRRLPCLPSAKVRYRPRRTRPSNCSERSSHLVNITGLTLIRAFGLAEQVRIERQRIGGGGSSRRRAGRRQFRCGRRAGTLRNRGRRWRRQHISIKYRSTYKKVN